VRGRRFSRSRRSKSTRRKVNWTGAAISFKNLGLSPVGLGGFNGGDIVTAWSMWPAGTVLPGDDSSVVNLAQVPSVVQPADQTVVRTLIQGTISYDLAGITQATQPVIAYLAGMVWDSQEPLHEAGAILQWPEIPHPADFNQDWLFRLPFPFTQDNTVQVIADATWINSRAMRKLPSSSGILVTFGVIDLVRNDQTQTTFSASFDIRHLVKSGAPAPVF